MKVGDLVRALLRPEQSIGIIVGIKRLVMFNTEIIEYIVLWNNGNTQTVHSHFVEAVE